MKNLARVVDRLTGLARARNRELALDAGLKVGLGSLFSIVTFGMLYWLGWMVGFFFARSMGLEPWQVGTAATLLFFVVAVISAWKRVDPLAGLRPLTDEQLMLTYLSQATPGLLYFSPRHAVAGMAVILLGGPANLFEALGTWSFRIRLSRPLLEDAARTLSECQEACPVVEIRNLAAAILLKRLALIKVVPHEDSAAIVLTQKGLSVLGKASPRSASK